VRILLIGASGFIGRELFAALEQRGHRVVAAVRNPAAAPRFAWEAPVTIDLNRDVTVEAWLPRLEGIDAVVNCAGILQGSRGQSIQAIHDRAPAALFAACEQSGVRRVVQISAISADRDAGTAYALTKLAADDRLRASSLDWVVLRPSVVHARGAYGGTSAFRALAAYPFAIPVPGTGTQPFQPIWIDDLSQVVALAIESDVLVRKTIDPVGPDTVALREILEDYRKWLGFERTRVINVPMWMVRIGARLGDFAGGTFNSTALAQLEHGNTGDADAFVQATGIRALGWKKALATHPAHAQDRWHARLYLLRPLLRAALAALWLISAFAGAFALRDWAFAFAQALDVPIVAAGAILLLACIADFIIAWLLVRRWRPRTLALVQVLLIGGYTAVATLLWPSLWGEALAPLAKNLPIVVAALVLGAIEEER
jgi:uncharacterized protein YbjT (DUF2867 family)